MSLKFCFTGADRQRCGVPAPPPPTHPKKKTAKTLIFVTRENRRFDSGSSASETDRGSSARPEWLPSCLAPWHSRPAAGYTHISAPRTFAARTWDRSRPTVSATMSSRRYSLTSTSRQAAQPGSTARLITLWRVTPSSTRRRASRPASPQDFQMPSSLALPSSGSRRIGVNGGQHPWHAGDRHYPSVQGREGRGLSHLLGGSGFDACYSVSSCEEV